MSNQSKISFTWLSIALSLVMHSAMEISSSVFFPKADVAPREPGAEMPPIFHVIYISAMILPMIVGFMSMLFDRKWFKVASLVYAALLALLNSFHFTEQVMGNAKDISQVLLLLYVVVANVYLILWINKWRKENVA